MKIEKYINALLPRMNVTFLLMLIFLSPPQPSVKKGKPDLKDDLDGKYPLKIHQHVPIKYYTSSFP